MKKNILYVSFAHSYFEDWFRENRLMEFETLFKEFFSHENIELVYRATEKKSDAGIPINNCPLTEATLRNDAFSGFLTNEKSQLAVESAKRALLLVGETAGSLFPPPRTLTLYGKSGSGKTFLLESIFTELSLHYPGTNFLKLQTLQYCHTFLEDQSLSPAHCPVVILDNFNDIFPSSKWQKILARHMRESVENGSKFQYTYIFALTGAIGDIAGLESELKQKIESGLVVEMPAPDLDIRIKYIEKINSQLKFPLKKEHIIFLAKNLPQLSQIKGALHKVEIFIHLHNHMPALLELERLLGADSLAKPADSRSLLLKVAKNFSLKLEDLLGSARTPDIVLARQTGMYLCRTKLGLSYLEIGRLFGGKDHSTVIHSIKKINNLRKTDKVMHNTLTELENPAL